MGERREREVPSGTGGTMKSEILHTPVMWVEPLAEGVLINEVS